MYRRSVHLLDTNVGEGIEDWGSEARYNNVWSDLERIKISMVKKGETRQGYCMRGNLWEYMYVECMHASKIQHRAEPPPQSAYSTCNADSGR